ncbi:hypothetical protein EVJ58_g3352, partial [Rhodofomes roseus]
NQGQIVLKPERFAEISATLNEPESPLEDRLRQASEREAEVLTALRELREHGPRRLTNGLFEWEEDKGIIYYKGKVYVPADDGLRTEVLRQCHDAPTAGHPGRNGTLELVSRHYWWPGMAKFVEKYVAGCDRCQRYKPAAHPPAQLHPLPVPRGPWTTMGVDLITGLPLSNGFDAIATFIDLYGKQVHFIPTTSTVDASGISDLHYREIFRLHGIPDEIVSDRGPQFAAKLMRELYKRLGINSSLTTAYHPQSNGQTERANQEVEKYIRLFGDKRQDDWSRLLPTAEFVINSRVASATGKTPFEAMYGFTPDFTVPVGRKTSIPALDQRLALLAEARKEAEAALRLSKVAMADQGKVKAPVFKVGDKVWLAAKNIKIHQASQKLGPRQLGPYEVTEVREKDDYVLNLPPALKVHPVFHVDRLSPYKGNDVNGLLPQPPEPVVIDGEEEYEVETILDSRFFRRQLQYLVQWKGYGAGDNSWEPAKNLEHAQKEVAEFHQKHPNAPRKINAALFDGIVWRSPENMTDVVPTDLEWETGRRVGIDSSGRRVLEGG